MNDVLIARLAFDTLNAASTAAIVPMITRVATDNHSALLLRLLHHGVDQSHRRHHVRGLGETPLAGPGRSDRLAVGRHDRLLVGRIAIKFISRPPVRRLKSSTTATTLSDVRSPGTTLTTSRLSASMAT
jgi:hypothetical protein